MDVQSKIKIIALFKQGASVDDVAKKYPGVERGTLIALKANVTRQLDK